MYRTRGFIAIAALAVIVLLVGAAGADTRDWTGINGIWNVTDNWSPAGTPASTDTLNVASGTATLDGTVNDLTINGGGSINLSGTGTIQRTTTHWTRFGEGSNGTYTQTGGTFLSQSGQFYMGNGGGTFTATISGGLFQDTSGGDFFIGYGGANGTLNVSGTALFQVPSGNFRVGSDNSGSGQGTVNLSGGEMDLLWLSLAQGNSGSKGNAAVSGGTMKITNDIRVGLGGTGTYTQNNGTVTASNFYVGSSGTGTATISNGTLTTTGSLYVAQGGTGSYTQSGGTVAVANLYIAPSGTGTFTMSNGTLTANGTLGIGQGGTGTYTQTGGTVKVLGNADIFIGQGGGTATQNVSGGLFQALAGNFRVGVDNSGSGQGTVNLSGGEMDLLWLSLAQGNSGSKGSAVVSGGTMNVTNDIRVGLGGTGTYTQSNGTVAVSGNFYAGQSGTGTVTISNGTLTANGALGLGQGGTGTYTQTGGTVKMLGGGDSLIGQGGGTANMTVSGGLFQALSGNFRIGVDNSGSGQGNVTLSGGEMDLLWLSVAQGNSGSKGNVTVSGGTMNITNGFRVGLSGTGTYTQTGGTVTVNGGQDHFIGQGSNTGTVTVNGGKLSMLNGNTRLGVDATGYLNIGPGADVDLNYLSMAQGGSGSRGYVTMTGGTLDVLQRIRVGTNDLAQASFTQSGGAVGGTNVRPVWIGEGGSTGTYTLTGGALTTNEFLVGLSNADSHGTFSLSGTGTATVNGYLYVGRNGGTGTVNVDGGQLSMTGLDTYINRDGAGSGTFNQTGGQVTNAGWFNVGANNGGSGAFNISGGQFSTGTLSVGREGFGTMAISQALGNLTTVSTTGTFFLGYYAEAAGSSAQISGGTLTVGGTSILGQACPTTFTQTGGTVNLQGATTIGQGGNTTYSQSGGNATISSIVLGQNAGVQGTYNLSGGTLTVGTINNGAGTGTFNFNGGTLKPASDSGSFMAGLTQANIRNGGAIIDTNGHGITIAQALVHSTIGGDNAVDGGLTKNGAGLLRLAGANTFTGPVQINAGTLVAPGTTAGSATVTVAPGGTLQVGEQGLLGQFYSGHDHGVYTLTPPAWFASRGSSGTYQVTSAWGTGLDSGSNCGNFPPGFAGNGGQFTAGWVGKFDAQTDGTYQFATASDDGSALWIDGAMVVNNAFEQGVTERSGSVFLSAGWHDIWLGFDQSGGGLGFYSRYAPPGGSLQILPNSLLASSTATTIGGLAGNGTVSLLAPSVLTVGTNNADTTFSGTITGNGSLSKMGAGALTLSGASTYTGPTSINAGKLLVDGSITSPVTVTGGMLGGNGHITGAVTVAAGGTVSAGDSPGHLTITGPYVQAGTMLAELGGTTQGTTYDWIDVNGTATFNIGAIVDVTAWNNWPSPGEGIPYYILTATGGITNNDLSGITFNFGSAPGWLGEWKASIVSYPAGGSGAEALMVEAVPEPATIGLVGLAVAGLAGYLRRRRKLTTVQGSTFKVQG